VTDLGIVIVSYNVKHFLAKTLDSIQASILGKYTVETWVVDNKSVDGSIQMVQSRYPDVKCIANKENVGFSKANNQAIRALNTRYVLILNPDTVLQEDTLFKSLHYLDEHPEVGALGPKMIDGTGTFLPESKRQLPGIWNSFCKLSGLSDIFPKSSWFSGYNLGHLSEDQTTEVDVLCGAFMMMPSSVLDKVGLLDEQFFMYGEDIDLSYRILSAGYKVIYYADTSIIHYKGESTKKSNLQYYMTFYGAMDLYVTKHYGSSNGNFFLWIVKIAIWLRGVFSYFTYLAKAWVRPIVDFALVYGGLIWIKKIWASAYFGDSTYYNDSMIDWIIPLYGVFWVGAAYFYGHYDDQHRYKWWETMRGILWGTAGLLIIYGLLPEDVRTSRAILLIGAIWTLLCCTLTSMIWRGWYKSRIRKTFAIVGSKKSIQYIHKQIHDSGLTAPGVYYISADQDVDVEFYHSSWQDLPAFVSALKVDEIIFSTDRLTIKEIIDMMTRLPRQVDYKISGDESLSIIGSSSRDRQGEYYSLEVTYSLAHDHIIWQKRILDLVVLVHSCFFPIFMGVQLLPIWFSSQCFCCPTWSKDLGGILWRQPGL
jgi:GT2 family glycosyltransferase